MEAIQDYRKNPKKFEFLRLIKKSIPLTSILNEVTKTVSWENGTGRGNDNEKIKSTLTIENQKFEVCEINKVKIKKLTKKYFPIKGYGKSKSKAKEKAVKKAMETLWKFEFVGNEG